MRLLVMLRLTIPVLACTMIFVSNGFADVIAVNNPSFEILPAGGLPINGDYSVAPIPDWINGGSSGQFQPGGPSGTVPNAYYNTLSAGPTEAYTNGGTISQTVGATVEVGVTYSLLVDIGARLDDGFGGVADLLINGNQYFATGVENLGGFATYTATYTGLAADAGDPITIQLSDPSFTGQGDFDNVRLTTATVPEPESVALLGTVVPLLGIVMWRRRYIRNGA